MNKVIINGEVIKTKGSNISVVDDKVLVDGEIVKGGLKGTVDIRFKGDLASLYTNANATILGDVNGDVDAGGNVECGDVGGDVDTGGSVKCNDIKGDVDAGGSVKMKRW